LYTWLGAIIIFIGVLVITLRELKLNKNINDNKFNINN